MPLTVTPTQAVETGHPADSPAPPRWNEVEHFVLFGIRGKASEQRVKRSAQPLEAFRKSATAAWNVAIPRSQLPKVLNGFRARGMDEKWSVCTEGPDASGVAVVHMFNIWHQRITELKIKVPLDEEGEGGFAEADSMITEIAWDLDEVPDEESPEEEIKAVAMEVLRWVMDVSLEKRAGS